MYNIIKTVSAFGGGWEDHIILKKTSYYFIKTAKIEHGNNMAFGKRYVLF